MRIVLSNADFSATKISVATDELTPVSTYRGYIITNNGNLSNISGTNFGVNIYKIAPNTAYKVETNVILTGYKLMVAFANNNDFTDVSNVSETFTYICDGTSQTIEKTTNSTTNYVAVMFRDGYNTKVTLEE